LPGKLTPIWIPDAAHEVMGTWCARGATAGSGAVQGAAASASSFLRHDKIYRGLRSWTVAYRRWLTTVCVVPPAQQIVLQGYIHAVQDAEARLDRFTRQIEDLLPSWSMAPVATAIQAMRGVALVVAVTVVAGRRRLSTVRQCATADGRIWCRLNIRPSPASGSAASQGMVRIAQRVLIEGPGLTEWRRG
jgi:transposase